ncbi:MAG: L-serine ammonia-lyase, iron-sulfur-dependent, subunit alpha [Clostridia bacterium]|jgi:L-cysteine desulfidase|nr:L-serine ammonia-lyase, iron-sulfur-dependent, subunit alpha [Clostridia bacterium]
MNLLQKQKIKNLINANLLVSTGCTEPIAIAYATAMARKTLNETPVSIELKLSGNMAKNAMDAGIPGSKYVGAAFVAALGALYADSSKGFELLEGLSKEQQEVAYEFSKKHVKIQIADTTKPLYIEAIVNGSLCKIEGCCSSRCCNTARVVVADGHTSIQTIEYNGEAISTVSLSNEEKAAETDNLEDVKFSMKEVYEYVDEIEDFSIFKKAINLNMALSEEGKAKNWGLDVGKIHPFGDETAFSRIVSRAASGVDARMAGAELPAMACTGSGNQGITVTLPIYQLSKELNKSEEESVKAVAVGILAAICIKQHLSVLSHLCGAVIASAGSAAGMTYLLGGDYKQAESAVQNVVTSVTGMFCDGAKSTCALKVAACVSMAIYAANLSMTETGRIKSKVGIACKDLEGTMQNVAEIEKRSSKVMDETILNIITK